MTDVVKKMGVKEFRKAGYLQELNRKFLHPLGLALEVRISPDGHESFGEVWDCRDDPEGMTFAPGVINPELAARIADEVEEKGHVRIEKFGWHIQPYLGSTVPVDPDLLRSSCQKHGLFDGEVCPMCDALDSSRRPSEIE